MNNPRPVTPEELKQLAIAAAEHACLEPLDGPDSEEVAIQRDFLLGSAVAAFDHYTTDSPGYQGTVYMVVWPGGPELHSTFIKDDNGVIREGSEI